MQSLRLDDRADDAGLRGPAPYPWEDGDDEAKYATYSREILDEQRDALEPLFLTWTQNLLFLAGLQWWKYDRVAHAFAPERKPAWKEQPVRNIMVPYFKHFMAKATKNRPAYTCVPASTDPDDIHRAQLGNDVLRGKWQELGLPKILKRGLAWVIPTGNAWLMPYWNTESGILQPLTALVNADVFDDFGMLVGTEIVECPCDEEGEPIVDEQGNYDLEAQPAFIDIGEVAVKVLSPYQVFFDAGITNEDEATFCLIVEPLTLREIRRRWPDAQDVVAEDTTEVERFDHFLTGLAAGSDTHLAGAHYAREDDVPRALVLHYFEKPSTDYPEGRNWVTTGRQMLEAPGPLPDGIWPVVVPLKDIEVPGQLHAESTMTAVVGLQREYNEVNAQIKEHHNLLLRGKWLVPIGSNIRRGQITTQPGEVIQHTPGLPPKMADLKPLPAEVYNEREKILSDFELITGIRKISMGEPPPGVTSGVAFLTLQEADDSDYGPFLENLENMVAKLGHLTLQIIRRNYTEERLIRVSGENNRYRVRAFKGADLESIVDVVPQSGSSFPWSQTAKQSMMIELASKIPELFTDPETGGFDQERFRRLLPVGGEEAVGLGADLDISEANREEEDFEFWDGTTPFPMVMPWQNHAIHLRQHGRVLKAESFKRWAPEAAAAFIQHWMETSVKVAELQMAQMQAEAAARGEAPGAGPPGKKESAA